MKRSAAPRPPAFTVFGLVNVLIGAVSVVTVPIVILALLKDAVVPEDHRIVSYSAYQSLVIATGAMRVALPFMILGSGIALLRGRRLGLWLALAWVLLALLELGLAVYLDWQTVIGPRLANSELRDPGAMPGLAESLGIALGRGIFVLAYAACGAWFLFLSPAARDSSARR